MNRTFEKIDEGPEQYRDVNKVCFGDTYCQHP